MLKIMWFGEFEDEHGQIHKDCKPFFGNSMEDLHEQVRSYVAEVKEMQDWCPVYAEIDELNDTRN
jgi:hypothetical protein